MIESVYICFEIPPTIIRTAVIVVMDILLIINFIKNFLVGIHYHDSIIYNYKIIFMNFFFSIYFWIELISCFPFETIFNCVYFYHGSDYYFYYGETVFLLNIFKLTRFLLVFIFFLCVAFNNEGEAKLLR